MSFVSGSYDANIAGIRAEGFANSLGSISDSAGVLFWRGVYVLKKASSASETGWMRVEILWVEAAKALLLLKIIHIIVAAPAPRILFSTISILCLLLRIFLNRLHYRVSDERCKVLRGVFCQVNAVTLTLIAEGTFDLLFLERIVIDKPDASVL